ncbi:MAG TPA: FHA domain-containing protein [Pseudobdellovibrionaceae bacterium]|nr:FHA domain-containing protein [Pseudobdellovibrionaceae bacterium]
MDKSAVCYFTMTTAAGTPISHIIDKASFTIGRSQSADIPILSSSISREHLRIEIQNQNLKLTDLGSANGTFVDGVALTPHVPTEISSDQVVHIGSDDHVFQFLILNRPQEMQTLESVQLELKSQVSTVLHQLEASAKDDLENRKKVIEQQGRESAQKLIQSAQIDAQKILEKAHNESLLLKSTVADEIKLATDKALIKAQEIKSSAIQDSQNLIEQAKKQAFEIKQNSQNESQRILQDAHKKSIAQQEEIDLQLERLTDIAQNKSIEILRQAEEKSNVLTSDALIQSKKIIEAAHLEVHALKERAHTEALEITHKAMQKSENIIFSAQAESNEKIKSRIAEHENEIKLLKEAALNSLEKERDQFLNKTKEEAKRQQEEIIDSFSNERENKQQLLRTIDSQILDFSHKRESLNKELELLTSKHSEQELHINENTTTLKLLQKKISENEEILKKLHFAEKKEIELTENIKNLNEKISELNSQFEFTQQKTKDEHSVFLNQLLVQKEQKKEELEKEMQQKKLYLMKQIDFEHQQEELRLQQLRKHQITDIARSIEINLIEKLGTIIPQNSLHQISDLSSAIFDIVTQQMSKQSSMVQIQTQTQKSETAHKQENRLIYLKRAGGAFAVVFIAAIAIFRYEILTTYRELRNSNVAREFANERKRLGVFKPTQDDLFRDNYVDNVIYLKKYSEIKLKEETVQAWTKTLSDIDFLTQHGLSEEDIIYFVAAETNMVKRLEELKSKIDQVYLKEELERIHNAEKEDIDRLARILKNEENLRLIRDMEKSFFQKLRSPAGE